MNAETGAIVNLVPGYSRAAAAAGIRGLQGHEYVQAITLDFAGAYVGAVWTAATSSTLPADG